MIVAFTLCSNNYLAHAKTLADSFLKFHPESKFIIGLVDKYDAGFDYTFFRSIEFILVEDIDIKDFEVLRSKYNIIELNTSVKPAYFHHIFTKYVADQVIYIDPDILIESRFEEVLEELKRTNIIITPHILTPVDDSYAPTDYHTLRGGVFNLGFIALSDYQKVSVFLDWWHHRVVKYGFANFALNMFYDQLWINYVPAFYDNYLILKHPGYNMANWNLHERVLSTDENQTFLVNKTYPLRFFHFSSYKYNQPNLICTYLTRYNFESRPDLVHIFYKYNQLLKINLVEVLGKLEVFYYPKTNLDTIDTANKPSLLKRAILRAKRSAKVLIKGYD